MVLSDADRILFYRLNWSLLFYVSRHVAAMPRPETQESIGRGPARDWLKLRDALYDHPAIFDQYAADNPERLPPDELAIVQSWRGFVRGEFYIWRCFRKHTVFLESGKPSRIFGVVALNKPFPLMITQPLPVLVETVLLPFKYQIVYDGLFSSYNVSFGAGVRDMLNRDYREHKARHGIITTLGAHPAAARTGLKFRYWSGFAPRLPYRLGELKRISDADVVPGKLPAVATGARKERILDLPAQIGLKDGFNPIQIEVLEIELDGRNKRIEVFNRAGSLFFIEEPTELQRFHRFVYVIEKGLPEGRRLL